MDAKTIKLLNNLSFPRKSEIHVSRHLLVYSERQKSLMSTSELKRSIDYDGSKFLPEFTSDTSNIIASIIEFGELKRFENINYSQIELEFTFSKDDYANGIGSDLKRPNNHSYNLVLILHRNNNKWEVTTCFPGTFTSK